MAAVTGQRSGTTQLEDLLGRFLTPVESPALTPEVPTVEKLLQRLVTVSTVWTEETLAGDTPGRECPHDDMEIRPRIGTVRTSDDRVPSRNIESPYVGGVPSLPGDTGSLLPGKFPAVHALK